MWNEAVRRDKLEQTLGGRGGGFWWTAVSGSASSSHLQVAVGVRERRLGVVHGQHQARAPHHQLVVAVAQLPVQVVRAREGQPPAAAAAAAAGDAGGVGADGDVSVGQVDVAVGQDEVRVVIFQLALVLARRQRNDEQKVWVGGWEIIFHVWPGKENQKKLFVLNGSSQKGFLSIHEGN